MVQRKLGLQAHLPNPVKGLQEEDQEIKIFRTPDFKKKIKKSRSMRLSNLETLKSSSSSSSSKKHDSKLPNYMKATSSSVARKELQQQQPQVSPNIKKHGPGSCNKPARTLTKSSSLMKSPSLKSVRTLMKSPSFKPARVSSSAKKKRSEAALCAEATCSSTMKDSKFPDFLQLNPEGTSIVKVCPYLYCSLNGHHHKDSPPLKMFLKAERRVLKTQKSLKKIEEAEFINKKPGYEDVDGDMEFYVEIFDKNKVVVVDDVGDNDKQSVSDGSTESEVDDVGDNDKPVAESMSDGSPKSEVDSEDDVGDTDKQVAESILSDGSPESEVDFEDDVGDNDKRVAESLSDASPKSEVDFEDDVGDNDKRVAESLSDASPKSEVDFEDDVGDNDKRVAESISDESPKSEVDFEDDVGDNEKQVAESIYDGSPESEVDSEEGLEDHKVEDEDEETHMGLAREEATMVRFGFESDSEEEFEPSMDVEVRDSEAMDMEWDEVDEVEDLSDLKVGFTMEAEDVDFLQGHEVTEDESRCEDTEEIASAQDDPRLEDDESDGEGESKASIEAQNNEATNKSNPEPLPDTNCNTKWSIRRKRAGEESEDESEFNPRGPNFLPLVPDPEAEKVDLRHQMMDERRNSDEWMLDYALQRTVTKLGPARKRKVALLVEAFESVLPVPRYAPAAAFGPARPIQACN